MMVHLHGQVIGMGKHLKQPNLTKLSLKYLAIKTWLPYIVIKKEINI
jgi:hypothetical protein